MEKITSLQNPRIKNIVKLAKSKERREQGLFVIEGARELTLALSSGYKIETVFLCPDLFSKTNYPDVLSDIPEEQIIEVSQSVFDKVAYREGSDGIIATAYTKTHNLENLALSLNPFIIVLEAVEKPGNLGAILRTADASQAEAVIICDPATDLYNPNTIRSSVGCLFTVPTAVCSSQDALDFLHQKEIKSFAAELQAAKWYHNTDFTQPSAIIMGTEADGLSNFWLENADARIKIPMRGKIDSLNVSVSTAILTFEAMRQRGF